MATIRILTQCDSPKITTSLSRCCNCKQTWKNIFDKPFQNIDKTYLDVNSENNLTLSSSLIDNLNNINVKINQISGESLDRLVERVDKIEANITINNF